MSSSWFHFTKQ